ncbi:HEPN domain-containing protein [Candidatus Poribacteria bacterium]|nr:HEPN domain-containing protein [Candidatus Poribacteria bacterium]
MTLVDEWVEKAEADYQAAVDLNRRRKVPLPDVVCYHCQQCAEKYLKAYLIAQGIIPSLTHDLEQLLKACVQHDTTLIRWLPSVQFLNPYGVLIRYPGRSATVAEAKNAVKTMRRLRTVLRRKLGL